MKTTRFLICFCLLWVVFMHVNMPRACAQTVPKQRSYNRRANIYSTPESLVAAPKSTDDEKGSDISDIKESLLQNQGYENGKRLPMSQTQPFPSMRRPVQKNIERSDENWLLPVSTPNTDEPGADELAPAPKPVNTGWGWLADEVQTKLQKTEMVPEEDQDTTAFSDEDEYDAETSWSDESSSMDTDSDQPSGGLLLDNNYQPTKGLSEDLEYEPPAGTLIIDDSLESTMQDDLPIEPMVRDSTRDVVQPDRVAWGTPDWNQPADNEPILKQTRSLLGEPQLKVLTPSIQPSVSQPTFSTSSESFQSSISPDLSPAWQTQSRVKPVDTSVSSFSGSSSSFQPTLNTYPASSGAQPVFGSTFNE